MKKSTMRSFTLCSELIWLIQTFFRHVKSGCNDFSILGGLFLAVDSFLLFVINNPFQFSKLVYLMCFNNSLWGKKPATFHIEDIEQYFSMRLVVINILQFDGVF